MSQDTIPYDFICQFIGRFVLESQFQQEQLKQQFSQKVGELQQKLAQEQQKRVEAERGLSG